MMKRLTSLLMTVLALSAQQANASEGDTIKVAFNGTSADVTIPSTASVKSTVSSGKVTLVSSTTSEEYVYDVSGTATDGQLIISGSYKLTLRLNGVSITSTTGAAIDVECGKRIAVELADGTVNTLVDAAGGSQKGAFYTTGHPEFQGGGTLNVTGQTKHAICAKEYLEVKKSVGTINVLSAVSDGIHCGKGKVNNENNYFQMNGGVVNIANVGGDGIDSDDYGTILIKGGSLNLNISGTDADGLKADSTLTIEGGTVNINVTGQESTGIRTCWQAYFNGGTVDIAVLADGAKGIKGKQQTAKTVNGGGSVYFAGAEVTILASGDNVVADGDTTKCMGVSVDADMSQTDGTVSIYAYGAETRTYNVKGTESTGSGFSTYYCPVKFNPYDYEYSMTAYVQLSVDGQTADLADYTIVAFCGDECRGMATVYTPDSGEAYAEVRIYSNSSSGEAISFKAYDDAGEAYTCSETVSFTSDGLSGTPGSPLSLTITTGTTLLGDMDGDGTISVADITLLIDAYLNSTYVATGDMDSDGELTVSDITQLIATYLDSDQ